MMSEGSNLPVQPIFVGVVPSSVFDAILSYARAHRVRIAGTEVENQRPLSGYTQPNLIGRTFHTPRNATSCSPPSCLCQHDSHRNREAGVTSIPWQWHLDLPTLRQHD